MDRKLVAMVCFDLTRAKKLGCWRGDESGRDDPRE